MSKVITVKELLGITEGDNKEEQSEINPEEEFKIATADAPIQDIQSSQASVNKTKKYLNNGLIFAIGYLIGTFLTLIMIFH